MTGLPSLDPDDGKFLALAGTGLSTLPGIEITLYVGVPAGRTSFHVGIFDGDLSGSWDLPGPPTAATRYRLYRDPLKNGTTSSQVATWTSAVALDDEWYNRSFATDAGARAPSGNYFYRLEVGWTGSSGSAFQNFKVRTDGQISLRANQEFGFAGGPQNTAVDPWVGSGDPNPGEPNDPGANSYDGEWRWFFYNPTERTSILFRDGDADRVDDTDDPNTPNVDPDGPGEAVAEGANPGAPADDDGPGGSQVPCCQVPPSIWYEIVDPSNRSFVNDNPSGNQEWEDFIIANTVSANPDILVSHGIEPGLWEFQIHGMNAHNFNALLSTYEIYSTPDVPLTVSPAPSVEPDHDERQPRGTTVHYAHTVTNNGLPDDFNLRAVSEHGWTTRIYRDVDEDGVLDPTDPQVLRTGLLDTNETVWIIVALDVPPGTDRNDTMTVTASSRSEWAVQDTAADVSRFNDPPVADAGGPYVVDEGTSLLLSAAASVDPEGANLTYRWDFDGDGTWDTGFGDNPTATYTWGDDWQGTVRVEVSDGVLTSVASANVTVLNVPPSLVGDVTAVVTANVTLRVAGEKWHDVSLTLYDAGVEVANVSVTRYPGSPDDQAATVPGVTFDLLGGSSLSAVVEYTPLDDPVNGQVWGANPVWIILTGRNGSEVRIHHTFNVRHNDTWVWEVGDLGRFAVRLPFDLNVTASDPGSDDLTFTIDWGDGTVDSGTVYNNGVSPDPYPSPEVSPITATFSLVHAYGTAGTYTVVVTVVDDDGGTSTTTFTLVTG